MVMTYSHAKVQGQRSVGSEDRVETNGRMKAIALPVALMRSVIMNTLCVIGLIHVIIHLHTLPPSRQYKRWKNFDKRPNRRQKVCAGVEIVAKQSTTDSVSAK